MKRLLHAGKLFFTTIMLLPLTTNVVAGNITIGKDNYIQYLGDIVKGDSNTLREFISSPDYQVQRTIFIMSFGGDVIDSLSSANIITAYRMNVMAINRCTSACTFILFSGRNKFISEGTEVGVHCPSYYINGKYHYVNKYNPSYWKLYGMLRAGGMSEKLAVEFLDLTFEHKRTKMRILTEQELKYFGVKILKVNK